MCCICIALLITGLLLLSTSVCQKMHPFEFMKHHSTKSLQRAKVLQLDGVFSLVLDSTPFMLRVMPLRVEEIEIGQTTLLATKLTHESVNTVPTNLFKDNVEQKTCWDKTLIVVGTICYISIGKLPTIIVFLRG